jgi:hypothetical protein
MIIWLASYPRSGNTFFRLVLRQVFGLNTYSVYNEFGVDDRQVQLVGGATADNLDDLAKGPEPCVVKTHELPGADTHPAIYLVRDGRDVIVSYAHYEHARAMQGAGGPAEPPRDPLAIMRDLIVHEQSFGGWGAHVERWLERVPAPVLVRFDQLVADPVRVTANAMAAAGAPVRQGNTATLPTFERLRRDMPQFFRTGRSGAYATEMPTVLQSLFSQRYGHVMRRLGYLT